MMVLIRETGKETEVLFRFLEVWASLIVVEIGKCRPIGNCYLGLIRLGWIGNCDRISLVIEMERELNDINNMYHLIKRDI